MYSRGVLEHDEILNILNDAFEIFEILFWSMIEIPKLSWISDSDQILDKQER